MKKFLVIFLILFLISFTAIVKNSTKRIDDMIFVSKEKIRDLKKDLANIKLEFNYLSSTERLLDFQNIYFDDELIKKQIQEIKIINQKSDQLEIRQLKIFDEK